MSEWEMLIIVFWAFYGLNGFTWQRRMVFVFTAWGGRPRARWTLSSWSCFRPSPFGWRLKVEDVPFSLSPLGIANIPVGATARPVATPLGQISWEWEKIDQVEYRRKEIWINGGYFAPATGHITVSELKKIMRLPTADREDYIRRIMRRWLRPHRLRRLHSVLMHRTDLAASANLSATSIIAVISLYLVFEGAEFLSTAASTAVATLIPWWIIVALALHLMGIIFAWVNGRKLMRWGAPSPGGALASALLFPAQALQLRATLAGPTWPAAHPLAVALAFASRDDQEQLARNTWTDLCWPLPAGSRPGRLSTAIADSHREIFRPLIDSMLKAANVSSAELVAAPHSDSPAVCAYCPRCHDQFIRADGQCPHGVKLVPLAAPGISEDSPNSKV